MDTDPDAMPALSCSGCLMFGRRGISCSRPNNSLARPRPWAVCRAVSSAGKLLWGGNIYIGLLLWWQLFGTGFGCLSAISWIDLSVAHDRVPALWSVCACPGDHRCGVLSVACRVIGIGTN